MDVLIDPKFKANSRTVAVVETTGEYTQKFLATYDCL